MDTRSYRLLLGNLFKQRSIEIQLPLLQRDLHAQLWLMGPEGQKPLRCRGELVELEAEPRGPGGFCCVLHLAAPVPVCVARSEAPWAGQTLTSLFAPKAAGQSPYRTVRFFSKL